MHIMTASDTSGAVGRTGSVLTGTRTAFLPSSVAAE